MTVALKKACSVQSVLGSESLGYLSRHTGAAGSQSGPEWRKAWEDKKKRWTWREGGKADLPFLPAGCSAQPFIGLVQPARTKYAGSKRPLCSLFTGISYGGGKLPF